MDYEHSQHEAVRAIRAIGMFANESIMTVPMMITRIYRGNIMAHARGHNV